MGHAVGVFEQTPQNGIKAVTFALCSLPLVFPVTTPSETVGVFEKMSQYMFYRDHDEDLPTCDENSNAEDLREGVDNAYNFYM